MWLLIMIFYGLFSSLFEIGKNELFYWFYKKDIYTIKYISYLLP